MMQLPRLQLLFVKHNSAYQYAHLCGICNISDKSGKSVHNRRLLELLLKSCELLLQIGDLVSKVGDFPFEIHQTF
jgi:hypothetical protein